MQTTTRNLSHKRNNQNDPSKNFIQFRNKKNTKYISQKKTTQTEAGKQYLWRRGKLEK